MARSATVETATRQEAPSREDSDAHKCDTCGDDMYDGDRSTCELCRSGYAPDFD